MPAPSSSAPGVSRQSRIPNTLQAVFLASNRGREVHKPPPEKVAYKVYFRNWLFQKQGGSGSNVNKGGDKKNSSLFGGDRLRARSKNLKTKQKAEELKQQSSVITPAANPVAAKLQPVVSEY
jgi:hypothetical protein